MKFEIVVNEKEAKTILMGLIGFEFILVVIYLLIHVAAAELPCGPFRPLSDLDKELTIAAWFSVIQLFTAGAILFTISKNNRQKTHLPSWYLTAGGIVLLFLSSDESAAIHERITIIAKQLDLGFILFKGGHGAWIYAYLATGVVALFLSRRAIRVLWNHYRHEFWIMISGTLVFLAGAVGLEIISYEFLRLESTTTLYKIEVAIEEFFEMSGVSLFLYSILLLNGKLTQSTENG